MIRKNKLVHAAKNPRTAIERVLSYFISNENAFRISDIGRSRDVESYGIHIDPFAIYWVSPSKITRHTGREYPFWENGRNLIGRVRDGDWDKRAPRGGDYPVQFEDRTYYKAAKLHFDHGVELSDDDFWYDTFPGKDVRDIKENVKRICDLVTSIDNNGYLTQEELGNHPRDKLFRHFNEITVDVARDGELLFVNSSHRLSAAKIANLDQVPVTVCVRHKNWMEKLDQQSETLPKNHPDVQNIKQ